MINFHGVRFSSPYPIHAMDADGSICGFTHPPVIDGDEWVAAFGDSRFILKIDPSSISIHWKNSKK